ncbi:phospholipase [Pyrenophora tritici-repentis Pt-1C-BFP]|uniref:Phospholipase n=2 Tax=Pyrenophora tritici-repentis TaxID=45151 RepID=B2W6C5_PYRTR|nr:phospholipase [Pyrenophora tritici-repentis Pt-1C-BFP]EDU48283.1 phospholipase [Pyrenophora tritici-repentis Pt-1C-BFP]
MEEATGGLIAIMLGRLEMSIDQCIEAYIEMMDVIFDPKDRRKLPFKIRNGKVQPKYKTKHIEQAIKQVISKAGRTSDDPFRGTKDSTCRTVVLALTEESRAPTLFTDYTKDGEHSNFYNEVKIWEVARATSAATSFFPPMEITRAGEPRRFLDAGLGFNNPIQELYVEAMSQFDKEEEDFDSQIRVLVSIGTGKPALRGFGEKVVEVAKSIASIATETQHTANNFHLAHMKLADRGGYFRFNPPDLSEVAIDEASMKGTIASRTETYGNDPETVAMVQRWKNVAGTEQKFIVPTKSSVKSQPLAKSVPTKLFYSLHNGPLYIRKDTSAYWQRLTLDSYYKYEEIYDRCEPRDRKVTFDSFFAQFGPSRTPSPSQVFEVWMRMLRDTNNVRRSIHRKPFIMAVLYMLHLETSLPDVPKMTTIEPNRREMLKRFVKWVPCQCDKKCGRQWNFVNEIGLSRGQTGEDECDLVDLYNHSDSWKLVFKGAKVKRLEATRKLWEATSR